MDKNSALFAEVAIALARLEMERDALHLAICGGEDAPGYAASLLHKEVLKVLAENYARGRDRAEAAEAEVLRLKVELAGPLPTRAGDLWWDANDGESGYPDPYEAYESVTDWNGNDYPVELSRARSMPHVWAVRVILTRHENGDSDETEVQLFNTEAEARAALQPDQGDT